MMILPMPTSWIMQKWELPIQPNVCIQGESMTTYRHSPTTSKILPPCDFSDGRELICVCVCVINCLGNFSYQKCDRLHDGSRAIIIMCNIYHHGIMDSKPAPLRKYLEDSARPHDISPGQFVVEKEPLLVPNEPATLYFCEMYRTHSQGIGGKWSRVTLFHFLIASKKKEKVATISSPSHLDTPLRPAYIKESHDDWHTVPRPPFSGVEVTQLSSIP
jgi:hypothetical protein